MTKNPKLKFLTFNQMIRVRVFYNRNNVPQIKIKIKQNIIVNIICNSLESLKENLARMSLMRLAGRVIVTRPTSLMSNEEILDYFISDSPPINHKQLAAIILPLLNFSKFKPKDLPKFIQEISPLKISREDAIKVLDSM